MWLKQRIQYAKTKSDVIAKADGTFVPRERRKRHEDKGKTFCSSYFAIPISCTLFSLVYINCMAIRYIVWKKTYVILLYGGYMGFYDLKVCFSVRYVAGKKRKEQHDASQAGMGVNPAYAGAYGAAPPVSIFSFSWGIFDHISCVPCLVF